ncbi:acetyl/propionyl/methylcrotonyl-CoA carboxylase subunit alpha [Kordiimonas laminariae]|uniref:acetyl/propionyl/methylcrotonyl-CoA carboxylase subunit alpha n=1 Tax=Kordiimonas laminariae TaxID=2917717 RepID=UPI001FF5FDBF|nr:acetyl/propionyl/methylcrotonyl-CoA carboxylase subunit alpha [Kordiimonas laminariae]MCK0069768.1 acetyl/propionyl/methylcrotonyl-CoA carboxylase subunit alpha [Kordiimonas laminariae]
MSRKIAKLLIANRGEIACRVMATCQKMGIKTVAVYSEADKDAMHRHMADEAVFIGPAAASESYLIADKIIEAAKRTGADAVHPGYGFLSENPEFAETCEKNDIIFVGPSAASMRAMALKGAAKKLMEDADVPVVPGYHGDDQSLETLTAEANRIGYPVLIKAVAGGGGKGMRMVYGADEIEAGIEAARREGENSFGNGKLLIEKLILKPRHIEVQVFGDADGNAVHLFERDCSLQRRHQKVVEEAPAPGMTDSMRAKMGEAAVKAAEAINYTGAGTVEFIADVSNGLDENSFYFMEMNTRLQVEHPVTEMITGLDLVEWQIMVAEGQALPLAQDEIDLAVDGHAVEVRLYAEDPYNDFLPSIGRVGMFDPYAETAFGARIDAGVQDGDSVSIHYDPMIGKLIAWGENRLEAIEALERLVAETPVTGLVTNRDFLGKCLAHVDFKAGDVHTGFIEEYADTLLKPYEVTAEDYAVATAAILAARQNRMPADDPWASGDTFRLNMPRTEELWFDDAEGEMVTATINHTAPNLSITVLGQEFDLASFELNEGTLFYTLDGLSTQLFTEVTDATVTFIKGSSTIKIARHARDGGADDDADGPGTIVAPMPGKMLEIKVTDGETVEKGQPLLVMEAMKMEQTINAPRDGVVSGLSLKAGDQVTDGTVLLTITDE